jgi:hypothetical protein
MTEVPMTVAELIEELKKHPTDAYVVADADSEFGGLDEGLDLEQIEIFFYRGSPQEVTSCAEYDENMKHKAVRFAFRRSP